MAAEILAFLLSSKVVGVTMTSTVGEGDAFTGCPVKEVTLYVGTTWTYDHCLRADPSTT